MHDPRGLAFNEYRRLYATNDGMQLRGTRPIKDDPDALVRLAPGVWLGWPDYTADLHSVAEARYQPPVEMLTRSGYSEISPLIDHDASGLRPPDRNCARGRCVPELVRRRQAGVRPARWGVQRFSAAAQSSPSTATDRRSPPTA